MLVNVQFCLQCGNNFPTQLCKLPKSSENDNYAENNVRETKHHPKPRLPADTTLVYSDHIMKGQPPPPPYEPVELKQATDLQASATVVPAGVKVDDSEFDEDTVELRAPHMDNYQETVENILCGNVMFV